MLRRMIHNRETQEERWRTAGKNTRSERHAGPSTVTYSPSFSSSFCLRLAAAQLWRSAAAAAVAPHRPLQAKERIASPEQRNSPL